MFFSLFRNVNEALFKQSSSCRVKLVAIAKNEAAYLAEWIYHHLYLGVDEIEIHYNRCSDNTLDYIDIFKKEKRVNFVNADALFENHKGNPQTKVYHDALEISRSQGFSHCLFLDIDEFLVPPDLDMRIKDLVLSLEDAEVISFQWGNKYESPETFTRALEQEIDVSRSRHVKSLIATSIKKPFLTPHGPRDNKFLRVMPNGEKFDFEGKTGAILTDKFLNKPIDSWFVMHRMFRSQKEYVALLARGRPNIIHKKEGISSLKSNRNGYGPFPHRQSIRFSSSSFKKYEGYINENLQSPAAQQVVVEGRQYVLSNFDLVLQIIENAPTEDFDLVEKVIQRVALPEVQKALSNRNIDNK